MKEGVEAYKVNALFAKGCDSIDPGKKVYGMNFPYDCKRTKEEADAMIEEAVETALKADKVVMCIGEHMAQTGEAASRGDITIPKQQKKLLRAVARVNKNIIVVLFNGRPLDIRKIKELAKAILVVWMPGSEGGNAITEVLYGETAPSGRLPMSFPYSVGQVPVFYGEFNTGRKMDDSNPDNKFQSRYIDIPNKPLYTFGYGLSYTEFTYSEVNLSRGLLEEGGELIASVIVRNTGKRRGAEVVQMYIRDDCGSVARPVRELKGFEKIWLEPGEEKEVSFSITEEILKFHDMNMNYTAEKGSFTVFIGSDSDTNNQKKFELI